MLPSHRSAPPQHVTDNSDQSTERYSTEQILKVCVLHMILNTWPWSHFTLYSADRVSVLSTPALYLYLEWTFQIFPSQMICCPNHCQHHKLVILCSILFSSSRVESQTESLEMVTVCSGLLLGNNRGRRSPHRPEENNSRVWSSYIWGSKQCNKFYEDMASHPICWLRPEYEKGLCVRDQP